MLSPHRNLSAKENGAAVPARQETAFHFAKFIHFLKSAVKVSEASEKTLSSIDFSRIYEMCPVIGIPSESLARYIAEFCGLPFLTFINPENIQTNLLTTSFSRSNSVIPLKNQTGITLVLSNPFNINLIDTMRQKFDASPMEIAIADPKTITFLLIDENSSNLSFIEKTDNSGFSGKDEEQNGKSAAARVADNILHTAIQHRSSDIHIEPKESHHLVRFRIDGDMKEIYGLKPETGKALISRLKVFGELDIAQQRKPQDGMMEAVISGKKYKLRLATTSTPRGESMIIRLLDQSMEFKNLSTLGLTDEQTQNLINLASRDRGMILIVGATGSGKTTTIYSLLSKIDCKTKSLISVEDPVEYRIPFANQQQVNEKAGITFETVLKSSVRQDPNILFIGEVRDPFSAKAALDFASTGHLTITSLHTSNATTAIFRLERLGVSRGAIADSIVAIVAQRLIKRLCETCKIIDNPTEQEKEFLQAFSDRPVEKVARPGGCPKCGGTGYWGREGIYEILPFTPQIATMIRSGKSIAEIRNFTQRQGSFLISHHAVQKVHELKFCPKDVYEKVLVEEPSKDAEFNPGSDAPVPEEEKQLKKPVAPQSSKPPAILIVEDDKDTRVLIARFLENKGYAVTVAEDGVDALLCLGKKKFDLIVSDINMPNLDGFRLLEMSNQKGISAPILFLTAELEEENERKGLALGAADYLKKPVQKEILLLRIERILKGIEEDT